MSIDRKVHSLLGVDGLDEVLKAKTATSILVGDHNVKLKDEGGAGQGNSGN